MRDLPATRSAVRSVPALTLLLSLLLPGAAAAQTDLVLNLSDSPDPVVGGATVVYTVVATNNGVTPATGVTFSLDVPAGSTWGGYSGTGVSCSGMSVGAAGPGTVTCTLPDLVFSASKTFTVSLGTTSVGILTISGTVSANEADAQPGNNTVSEATTVVAGADVALTVTAPASVASSATLNYGLSLYNAGPSAATQLRIQFPLPAGFSQSGGLPGGCSSAAGTVTCTVAGPLAVGGTLNVGNISGKITATNGSTVSGSASLSLVPGYPVGTALDPNSANNTVAFSTSVTAGTDLKLTKSRSASSPYFIGGTFNFTLTASYSGDVPSTLTITDVVPANYTINAGSFSASQNGWSCGLSGQTVTCTRASGGGAGGSNIAMGSISIPVTIVSAGTVTNTATISAVSPAETNNADNTASDGGATLQNPNANLALTKSGPTPALAVVGQSWNYTLTASNGGPSVFYGTLIITDTLDAGLTLNSYTLNGWSCTPAAPAVAPVIQCQRTYTSGSTLASGASAPAVTLNVTATTEATITNVAQLTTTGENVSDPTPGNNTASYGMTTKVAGNSADVTVTAAVDQASVPAGDTLSYTLEVVNDGPAASTNVVLTDVLGTLINSNVGATGAGLVGYSVTPNSVLPGDINCSTSAGSNARTLTCSFATVPVCTVAVDCPTIKVTIRPGGNGGTRSNTVSVVSNGTPDPVSGNNSASVNTTVLARADVTVSGTVSPSPAPAGQNLVYTITGRDNGPSQAANLTVTQTLPLDVYFISASPSSGSCATTPTVNTLTAGGNQTVTCNLGTVSNGAQKTVTVTVRPTDGQRSTLLTSPLVVTTTTTQPDAPGVTDDSSDVSVTVANPSTDLLVNNTDTVDPVVVGNITAYTVVATNVGPSDAENVVLTDTLPAAGLSYQSVSITSGSCPTVPVVGSFGGLVQCTVPRIAVGASVTLTITVEADAKGVHTNWAGVASDETALGFEPSANNAATQRTTARTTANLAMAVTSDAPATVAVRDTFNWTLEVTNIAGAGLAEADSVWVTNTFPAAMELTGVPQVTVVSGTATATSCTGTAGGASVTCDFGTMSPGAVVTVVYPVRLTTVPAGNVASNPATVGTSSYDPVSANNSATGTAVIAGSSLSGKVFRDFANDGAVDSVDTGISGISMTLAGTAFDGLVVNRSVTTGADGSYSFTGLPQGTYGVTRGAVGEAFLTLGQQTAGDRGGNAGVTAQITAIALGPIDTATGYNFGYVPHPRIGAALRVSSSTVQGDGSFLTVLRWVVKNHGLEPLTSVTLSDTLSGAVPALGSFVAGGSGATLTPGTYTVQTGPGFVGSCTGGTTNAGYDGDSDGLLAQVTSIAAAGTCDVQVTLRLMPTVPLPGGGYASQAEVHGTGGYSSEAVSDRSETGSSTDPNGDNDPTNNNTPTVLTPTLVADVATTASFPATDAGKTVAGTVTYRNGGPYTANGVTYALTLSSGLSGVTIGNLPGGASALYNSGNGVVTLSSMPGTLTAGQIASGDGTTGLTVSYTQRGTASSTVAASIATSTSQGANSLADAANTTVTGNLIADVASTMSYPASVDAGQTVSGRVVYRNQGPSTASGLTYTLRLSSGLTGVTFANLPGGAGANYTAGTGIVTFTGMPATLASGAMASSDGINGIRVNYTQNATASSTLTSAIGTTTGQDANALADTANVTVTGNLIADVTTTLSHPTSVNAGQTVSGRVVFRNNGPSVASGLTYGVVLTAGVQNVVISNLPGGASATVDSTSGLVTFTGMPATLASGAVASGDGTQGILVSWTQPGTASSSIASAIGTTTLQGSNTGPDAALTSVGGTLIADVTTSVSFPASVNAGLTVNGTVRFQNDGPSTSAGMNYTLTLTSGLGGVTVGNLPAGASASYNPVNGVVTLAGMPGTLTSGQIASGDGTTGITVAYTQAGTATSTVQSAISTSTSQGANAAADAATTTVSGSLIADVATTLSFPASVDAGQAVSGRIVFRNRGPSTGSGMTYQVTLASGLSNVTVSNLPVGASASYTSNTGVLTLSSMPATLTSGAIASNDGTAGLLVGWTQPGTATSSVASVVGTSTLQGADTAANSASATVTGNLVADVTTAIAIPGTVDAGDTVAATVTFRNAGPSTASSVTYALTLTSGLSGVTLGNLPVGASASYASGSGIVTLSGMPATLAAGAFASGDGTHGLSLSYIQPGTATSTITSAITTGTGQGANAELDNASATPGGGLVADVTALLTFPASVNAGDVVQGTARYRNNGPSISSGMGYTLTLPAGLTGVAFSNLPVGASASYNPANGQVTLTGFPATLAPGAIASGDGTTGVGVQYHQPGSATSVVASTVSTSTGEGADLAPNSASATVNGTRIVDVTTALTFPAAVDAGQTVSGRLLYRNLGPSQAASVGYTLTLGTGLGGVAFANLPAGASASYNPANGVVSFTAMPAVLDSAELASGDHLQGILVSYTQPGVATSQVTSGVTTATSQGVNAASDTAGASITGDYIADVTTVLSAPATNAGDTVHATLAWRNTGPSLASGLGYTLTLLPHLRQVGFANLPTGAIAAYDSTSGAVNLTGMPATLTSGTWASGDGSTAIALHYIQPGTATSSIAATIGTSTRQGANLAADSASVTSTGILIADVTVTVALDPSAAAAATVHGTVLYRNLGPSTASGMSYTVTLPAQLTGVVIGNLPGGANASYTAGTGQLAFTGMPTTLADSAVASGDGVTGITIAYIQPGSATSTVQATVATSTSQGGNAAPDFASATVTGAHLADVTTALLFPALVDVGQTVSGRVTYRNLGPSPASGLGYRLNLAHGLGSVTFGNLPPGASASYNPGTGDVTFTAMPVQLDSAGIASADGTNGIVVQYAQPVDGMSDVASGITTSTNQVANLAPDSARVTVFGLVDVTPVLAFPAAVDAGDTVAGTVAFRNYGPSTASGMTYSLALTPGLAGVTFSNLPPGANASYNPLSGTVALSAMPATLVNGAVASADGTTGIGVRYVQPGPAVSEVRAAIGTSTNQGINALADSGAIQVAGGLVADLAVTTNNDTTRLDVGQRTTYTIRVLNHGPSDLPVGALLRDAPTGLAPEAVTCSATGGNQCSGTLTPAQLLGGIPLPVIPVGGVYEIRVTALVTVPGGGVSSSASLTMPNGVADPNQGNNSATDTDPIFVPAIAVAKAAAAPVSRGGGVFDVDFTLVLENAGGTRLEQVQVRDDLSAFGSYHAGTDPRPGEYSVIAGPALLDAVNGAAITPVAAGSFTGATGGTTLLVPGTSWLPEPGSGPAARARLGYTVRYSPTVTSSCQTQPVADAATPGGFGVSDLSSNGSVPDTLAASATSVACRGEVLAVQASAGKVTQTGTKRFEVPFTVQVRNADSISTATNVQLVDDLTRAFPTAQRLAVVTAPVVTSCSGTLLHEANPVYDGQARTSLLSGDVHLEPLAACTVTFTAEVDFGTGAFPLAPLTNTVVGTTAQAPAGPVLATSQSDVPVMFVPAAVVSLTKSTPLVNVTVGQLVPYTIAARNVVELAFDSLEVRDVMPAGFQYRKGSAAVDGVATEPVQEGRTLRWRQLPFASTGTHTITLMLAVGSGVTPGEYTNVARAFDPSIADPAQAAISDEAAATVRVVPDPFFACSDVIGKVYEDRNGNGVQDREEPGVAGATLVTARGWLVTADADGRYHIACAATPDEELGSSFVLKLDTRPFSRGTLVTSGNPRTVRLTAGKVGVIDFGVRPAEGVALHPADGMAPDTAPASRWFSVGLADLTIGLNHVDGPAADVTGDHSSRYQEDVYGLGRVAFYLKGRFGNDTRLTASADTREHPLGDLLSSFGRRDPQALLRRLDANSSYPVFGDDGTLTEDAPTQGNMYLRVDHKDSHLLWGSFQARQPGSDLVTFGRGLYGGELQHQSLATTRYGERRTELTGFAADPGTIGAREEFRGTGGSLYYLQHQDVLVGSEQVRVEVRDRESGIVLASTALAASQDYELNSLQGRLLLREPLSAIAERPTLVRNGTLDGNPVVLVVTYEYTPGVSRVDNLTTGGRASAWLGDHLRLGATGYKQNGTGMSQELFGADLTLRYRPGTYLRMERARSEGPGSSALASSDGGFGFSNLPNTAGANDRAFATRAEVALDLAELEPGMKGKVTGYWLDRDAGFSAPGQLTSEWVRQRGASATLPLTGRLDLSATSDFKEGATTGRARAVEVNAGFGLTRGLTLAGGLRNDERQRGIAGGSSTILSQAGERTDVIGRLEFASDSGRASHPWGIYGLAQGTVSRDGERSRNNRYGLGGRLHLGRFGMKGEVTDGDGGTGSLAGLEYDVGNGGSVYLNYLVNPDRSADGTGIRSGLLTTGARVRYSDATSVFAERKQQSSADGRSSTLNAMGVDLAHGHHWSWALKLERGTLSDPYAGDLRRTAASVGSGYLSEPFNWSGAVEYRTDRPDQGRRRESWLIRNSVGIKASRDWRWLSQASFALSDAGTTLPGDARYTEIVTGLAYRPLANNRVSGLLRYTFLYDLASPGQVIRGSAANTFAQRSHVVSADANFGLTRRLSLGGKIGYRAAELRDNTQPGGDWLTSNAWLGVARVDWLLLRRWEVLAEGRSLTVQDADSRRGVLVALYRQLGGGVKLGVGYNFTDYSDDLTNLSYRSRGLFLNLIGQE